MKLRKRLLLFGAILTLVCFSFAACGDAGNGAGNENQPEDTAGMDEQPVELDENGIPYYDIPKVTVDENGVASWEPMIAAKGYEITYVFEENGNPGEYVGLSNMFTTETSAQIPEGLCLMIRAMYEDGNFSDTAVTEYYGEPITSADQWDERNMAANPEGDGGFAVNPDEGGEPAPNPDEGGQTQNPEGTTSQGTSSLVTVDENGVASWEKVQGAVEYVVEYLTMQGDMVTCVLSDYIRGTSVQIPEGYALDIRAIMADGSRNPLGTTEFWGEPVQNRSAWYDFDVDWDNMLRWDLIANLDADSLQTKADGSLYFEATAPNGEKMGFWAEDVTLKEGGIVFGPAGRIIALDSIGRIYAYQPKVVDAEYASDFFVFMADIALTVIRT